MIPRSKIDEIVDAAHIEDVVGEYISLKKRGSSLLGLCPFHNEKTPSFNVSPVKGIYKCFGCGKAGNSVNFIMEYEHLDYIQALKFLAEKYRIEWPEREISSEELQAEKQLKSERESLQIINNFAEKYFAEVLLHDEEGKNIGLSYFEERGFRPETIEKFKLGYSKDSWDHFTNAALKNGFNIELLKKAGLVKESEQGKQYDAYRGRVMFTIHSLSGKPIAFAGRFLKKDPKSPKYVNSPETELYHKSNELYGLYYGRNAISKTGFVYLVEGYTDVISMHQAGVENVVASSGTSLTENQIKLIKRFTSDVCVLYDGDAAGIKASLRGIDMLLEAGLNVKTVSFPDGEDPDSYCQKAGPEGFAKFLDENKKDFILFKTSLLAADAGNDPVKKAQLIREIVESITKIPDAFKRMGFIKETGRLLQVDEQLLVTESNRILRSKMASEAKADIAALPEPNIGYQEELRELLDVQHHDHQEKDLLRTLLSYANQEYDGYKNVAHYILHMIADDEMEIESPVILQIVHLIQEQLEAESIQLSSLVNHEDPKVSKMIADILSSSLEISPNWGKKFDLIIEQPGSNYKYDVESALGRLKLKNIEKMIRHNQDAFNQAENDEAIDALMRVHQHLIELRSTLTEKWGTVILK
ncbi:MAG: DNA primase [Bacteroidota bacterium]